MDRMDGVDKVWQPGEAEQPVVLSLSGSELCSRQPGLNNHVAATARLVESSVLPSLCIVTNDDSSSLAFEGDSGDAVTTVASIAMDDSRVAESLSVNTDAPVSPSGGSAAQPEPSPQPSDALLRYWSHSVGANVGIERLRELWLADQPEIVNTARFIASQLRNSNGMLSAADMQNIQAVLAPRLAGNAPIRDQDVLNRVADNANALLRGHGYQMHVYTGEIGKGPSIELDRQLGMDRPSTFLIVTRSSVVAGNDHWPQPETAPRSGTAPRTDTAKQQDGTAVIPPRREQRREDSPAGHNLDRSLPITDGEELLERVSSRLQRIQMTALQVVDILDAPNGQLSQDAQTRLQALFSKRLNAPGDSPEHEFLRRTADEVNRQLNSSGYRMRLEEDLDKPFVMKVSFEKQSGGQWQSLFNLDRRPEETERLHFKQMK